MAKKKSYNMKQLVSAVRSHPQLGRGSCSYIDETLTDKELGDLIRTVTIPLLRRKRVSITKDNVISELTGIEHLWREADPDFASIETRKTESSRDVMNRIVKDDPELQKDLALTDTLIDVLRRNK